MSHRDKWMAIGGAVPVVVVCTGIYDPPNVVCFSIVCNEISQTQCTMCIEMNASMYDRNV